MAPLRPQPRFPEVDSEPFWEATKRHELTYQTCNSCNEVIFYPRGHCPQCGSIENTWHVSQGLGSVYTYSVIMQSRHPAFRDLGPLRRRLRRPGRGLPLDDQHSGRRRPHPGHSMRDAGQGPVGRPGRGRGLSPHVRTGVSHGLPACSFGLNADNSYCHSRAGGNPEISKGRQCGLLTELLDFRLRGNDETMPKRERTLSFRF